MGDSFWLHCALTTLSRRPWTSWPLQFADEISPELRFTGAGILAMANSGPNTNGSQFFISLAPTPHLDRKHTIFGRVAHGMGVVQRMGLVAVDADDRPREEVKIIKATATDA